MVNWDKYNNDNVSKLSFEGETIECKVVKVYDGDTITVVFPLKYKVKGIPILGQMYKWNCRLIGIDTPELRTKCPIRDSGRVQVVMASELIPPIPSSFEFVFV